MDPLKILQSLNAITVKAFNVSICCLRSLLKDHISPCLYQSMRFACNINWFKDRSAPDQAFKQVINGRRFSSAESPWQPNLLRPLTFSPVPLIFVARIRLPVQHHVIPLLLCRLRPQIDNKNIFLSLVLQTVPVRTLLASCDFFATSINVVQITEAHQLHYFSRRSILLLLLQ